jgi:hypothetical protein
MQIDEVYELLNELSEDIPEVFFHELNGGINLLPDTKNSPYARSDDLFIMGDYNCGGNMGRYINIYYGSMMRIYGHLSRDELKKKLWEVLMHEFRHHMESLAGERGLEKEDEEFINNYLDGKN